MNLTPKWWRERAARRDTDRLVGRVLTHWAGIGHDGEFDRERYDFFLESNRRRRGLAPKGDTA